jgi:hypothetical protein
MKKLMTHHNILLRKQTGIQTPMSKKVKSPLGVKTLLFRSCLQSTTPKTLKRKVKDKKFFRVDIVTSQNFVRKQNFDKLLWVEASIKINQNICKSLKRNLILSFASDSFKESSLQFDKAT